MPEALIITPVKDSITTTEKTIRSVHSSLGDFLYVIYNDFSNSETKYFLQENQLKYDYELIHLEDVTQNPSPNYKLVLQMAHKKSLELNVPLVIVESDVIVKENTFKKLLDANKQKKNAGMVGAVTVDEKGNYNFPYNYIREKTRDIELTKHSLSFCCTLLSLEFLKNFNFEKLSSKKDWFDIYISRKSKKLGFGNYLAKDNEVLHLPHSSRPWKQLKYTNPVKYYFYKYLKGRDRI
ncbi:MAG: glycosyltransferase family 2 protein [Prolixibacteraceae bacterium]|nr:glycosyltransferase family 2 protein [Prolixibacteraceae bacterium]MBN2774364.1 glycosyltransferase family 2 protein [Prolixibacteraceae bacterium]